ncbi:hypothetical protein LX32DRAFT_18748 [Colletotrichum zoysiae]|uniref:Uncharacterized protein n=1 Tax=Colletotrichum zoysiae TaxID=1216348 RepID=A0AAD9HEJ5_9PEZI|nr:hypothetical protein LX32DRAFT_18748 [Colletotrichum zoysiae]
MLGLSSNPISAIPPLNTIPTSHSTPAACIWPLVWAQFFSFPLIANYTRSCAARACACSSSTTAATRPPPVEAGFAFRPNSSTKTAVVTTPTTTTTTTATTTTTTTTTTKTPNHALRPLQPLRHPIGRIAGHCIANTTAVQAIAKAKAKGPARATVACTCTTLHSFVRVPTHLAANLISLLREPTLTIRQYPFSRHTRSSIYSSCLYFLPQRLSQSPLSLLLPPPPPPLRPLKEALATSKSLAQASLQSPRRQDSFPTLPRKAVVLAAAFVEPFLPRLPTRQTRLCHRPP